MKNYYNIIFNYMPPAIIEIPSISFSTLKAYLNYFGYNSKIIYWNILMKDITNMFESSDSALISFFDILSDKYHDNKVKEKLFYSLNHDKYGLIDRNYYYNLLKKNKNIIYKIIHFNLNKINIDNVIFFGFTAKHNQWIPAIVLSNEIKKLFPESKIVIGGLETQNEAYEMLDLGFFFDYAIWGEGEYPLLELCNNLKNKINNFDEIPRLIYRQKSNIKVAKINNYNTFSDFNNYIYPEYNDYFKLLKKNINNELRTEVQIPIITTRGCSWNKCKWCYSILNQGYKYRERLPESIVKEIEYLYLKYNVHKYIFTDNNVIGKNIERFEKLLDLLSLLNIKTNKRLSFFAEIIHKDLNADIINKMKLAGFKSVQIGYEATSDSLLKKMNKKTRFADNILWLKFSILHNIYSEINIVSDFPNEDISEIHESINNLHYLRFFLKKNKVFHTNSRCTTYNDLKLYKTLPNNEKESRCFNKIKYFLPTDFVKNEKQLYILGYINKTPINSSEWDIFYTVEKQYLNSKFDYKILKNKNNIIYKEYLEGKFLLEIIFDKLIYWDVLKQANDEVVSLNYIHNNLLTKYPKLKKYYLKKIIMNLKSEYLMYSNSDFSNIVTIIDTS